MLDVMLPEIDGWIIIPELQKTKEPPVMLLTIKNVAEYCVHGREFSADAYLVKPFAFAKLVVRIRTPLRPIPLCEADRLDVGKLQIDVLRRKEICSGNCVNQTTKKFALSVSLTTKKREGLSRSLMSYQDWAMNFDCITNVACVAVRRRWAKINGIYLPTLIHVVCGMGYVFKERP